MKHLLLTCIFIIFLSCETDTKNLKNGFYEGSFKYDTLQLWESFGINDDNFIEYASGGVMYQKFPLFCLTKGTYRIHDGIILFNNIQIAEPPNKNVTDCEHDCLLMGSYNIEALNDSIISFWRNSKLGKQEYKLRLYYAD